MSIERREDYGNFFCERDYELNICGVVKAGFINDFLNGFMKNENSGVFGSKFV